MNMRLAEVAELVGGELLGDPGLQITGLNGIREAEAGEISFVRGGKYLHFMKETRASAVLLAEPYPAAQVAQVIVAHPDLAFGQLLAHLEKQRVHPKGVHEFSAIAPTARLGANVAVDAFVRIEEGADIGDNVILYAGVYIGRNVRIGANTIIYPNAVIREETEIGARCIIHAGVAIGSDGFGFTPIGQEWVKVPQVGKVVFGDDVEIGSNTTIDRATCGVTRLGRGVKIDNLVQIGHNCRIGDHSAIAGMAGVAGSAVIGKGVRIGACAGINGHIEIGDGATVGGRAGVTKSLEAGRTVSGFPAMDHNIERRVMVAQQRVPELLRRVRQLERQLEALEKKRDE